MPNFRALQFVDSLLLEQLPDFKTEPSPADLTKLLLNTLSDESNPLTHSDLSDRSGSDNVGPYLD